MKTTRLPLDYIAAFHIAENAARVLWEERPAKDAALTGLDGLSLEVRSNLRSMARRHAVGALRWLWQNGTAEERILVAARVRVWCLPEGEGERRSHLRRFIESRERARRRDGSLPKNFRVKRISA